jgi:8-oxo-dGTP diphosphatase
VPRVALGVVAAVLVRRVPDAAPEVLIAQRPPGKWQAGRWEFPGGKIERAETPGDAVVRELREELGVTVRAARPLGEFSHDYPDRSVCIGLWLISAWEGEPQGLDGQALRWVALPQLAGCDLLEADRPMLEPLRRAIGWQVR